MEPPKPPSAISAISWNAGSPRRNLNPGSGCPVTPDRTVHTHLLNSPFVTVGGQVEAEKKKSDAQTLDGWACVTQTDRLNQRDGGAGSCEGRQVRLQRDGRYRGNGQAIGHSQTAEFTSANGYSLQGIIRKDKQTGRTGGHRWTVMRLSTTGDPRPGPSPDL